MVDVRGRGAAKVECDWSPYTSGFKTLAHACSPHCRFLPSQPARLQEGGEPGGEAPLPASETPYTLLTRASVSVGSVALLLVSGSTQPLTAQQLRQRQRQQAAPPSTATIVASATMERVGVRVDMYPRTQVVQVRIGAAGVSTAHGQLFRSGLMATTPAAAMPATAAAGPLSTPQQPTPGGPRVAGPPASPFPLPTPGGVGGAAGSFAELPALMDRPPSSPGSAPSAADPASAAALALDLTKAPQDGSADMTVVLLVGTGAAVLACSGSRSCWTVGGIPKVHRGSLALASPCRPLDQGGVLRGTSIF